MSGNTLDDAQRRLLLGICLIIGAITFVPATYNFVIHPMLEGLGASESQSSLLRQLPSTAALLVIFLAGVLGNRWGGAAGHHNLDPRWDGHNLVESATDTRRHCRAVEVRLAQESRPTLVRTVHLLQNANFGGTSNHAVQGVPTVIPATSNAFEFT